MNTKGTNLPPFSGEVANRKSHCFLYANTILEFPIPFRIRFVCGSAFLYAGSSLGKSDNGMSPYNSGAVVLQLSLLMVKTIKTSVIIIRAIIIFITEAVIVIVPLHVFRAFHIVFEANLVDLRGGIEIYRILIDFFGSLVLNGIDGLFYRQGLGRFPPSRCYGLYSWRTGWSRFRFYPGRLNGWSALGGRFHSFRHAVVIVLNTERDARLTPLD